MSVEQATSAETALAGSAAKRGEARMLGPIAVGLALLSAFVTFIVLADLTPILPTHDVVVTLLLVNAATVLLLLGVIMREVWQVVQARRSGRAAARLHVRIVGLFSIIAAAPAILVAIVASVTLDRGLDRLFSTRTRAAIENSLIVAEAYLRDHAQIVRSDIMVMATDIARNKPVVRARPCQAAAIPDLPGVGARAGSGHRHRQGPQRRCARRSQDQPDFRHAAARRAAENRRDRTAVGPAAGHQLCRGGHQAAGFRRRLSLPDAAARSERRAAIAGDAGERERICRDRGAPLRRADRVCADVHRHRAHRAAIGGLGRVGLRQSSGGADPAPDRRRQCRLHRQPACARAGAPVGRRSRPARRNLQPHDARIAQPARRHHARARPHRQPAPLHRGGARRRQRGRHRRRWRWLREHPQPLGGKTDRPHARPKRSAGR